MAKKMSATERAARDVANTYVRNGLMSRTEANKVIRDGLGIVETAVRDNYREGFGSTLYYAGKVAKAREEYEAASNMVARRMKATRLLGAELYAAVFAAVQAESGVQEDSLTPDKAEQVMRTVRDTAREVRDESNAKAGLRATTAA